MGSVIVRKHKKLFAILYLIVFFAYVFIGFQPMTSSATEDIDENASGRLLINSISLDTPVVEVSLKDHTLNVPDDIAGSFVKNENKTFLFGHSSTVFKNLKSITFGDTIDYNDHSYKVVNIETRKKEEISMNQVLKAEEKDTVILMTCTGESLGNNDYTHRLIITAEVI